MPPVLQILKTDLTVTAAPSFDKPGISPEGQAFFLLMENAAGKVREKK